jgi:hypothetical protein
MDNYEHKIEHFSVGVVFYQVFAAKKCNKPSPPPPPPTQYAKWGWCAAMTLRQYFVCRECRKVAQHCDRCIDYFCCCYKWIHK